MQEDRRGGAPKRLVTVEFLTPRQARMHNGTTPTFRPVSNVEWLRIERASHRAGRGAPRLVLDPDADCQEPTSWTYTWLGR